MGDRAAAFAKLPKPSSEDEEKDAVMLNEWGNLDNDIRIKLIKGRLKKDCKMRVVIPARLEAGVNGCFVGDCEEAESLLQMHTKTKEVMNCGLIYTNPIKLGNKLIVMSPQSQNRSQAWLEHPAG